MRYRLLDLFCGAGGAARGYMDAGFDVTGVDLAPQPRYPGRFVQADALTFPLDGYDAIHASPPCLVHSRVSHFQGAQEGHADHVPDTRARLDAAGVPWVIENVDQATSVRRDLVLCGEMFGLRVHRHRVFELGGGFFVLRPPHATHALAGATGNGETREGYARGVYGHFSDPAGAHAAMGIDWRMTREELALAIPPAYTRWIGERLRETLDYLRRRV